MNWKTTKSSFCAAVAGALLSAGTVQAQTHVTITNLLFSENFSSYSAGSLPTTVDAGGLWRAVSWTSPNGSASVVTDDANVFGQGTENKFFRAASTTLLTLDSPYFHPQDVAIFEFDFIGRYLPDDDSGRWLQMALKTGTGWAHITSARLNNATIRTAATDTPPNPSYGGNDKRIRLWTVMNNRLEPITYDRPDGAGTATLSVTNASVWIYHYENSTWQQLLPSYSFGRDANTLSGRAIDFVRFLLDSNAAQRSFDVDNIKVYGSRVYVPPVHVAITNLLFADDFEKYPVGSLPASNTNGGEWATSTWTGTIGTVGVAEDVSDVFGLGAANRYLQASNANFLTLITPVFNPRQDVLAYAFDFVGHYYEGIDGARWLNVDARGPGGTAHLTSLAMSSTTFRGVTPAPSYGLNDSVVRVLTVLNNGEEEILYDRPDGNGTANLGFGKASVWIRAAGYGWEHVIPSFVYSRTAGFPSGATMDNVRFYLDSGVNRSFDMDNVEVYGSIKPIPLPVRLSAAVVDGKVRVRWNGIAGSTYQIQHRGQLGTGEWANQGDPFVATINGEQIFEEDLGEARFYRVVDLTE